MEDGQIISLGRECDLTTMLQCNVSFPSSSNQTFEIRIIFTPEIKYPEYYELNGIVFPSLQNYLGFYKRDGVYKNFPAFRKESSNYNGQWQFNMDLRESIGHILVWTGVKCKFAF